MTLQGASWLNKTGTGTLILGSTSGVANFKTIQQGTVQLTTANFSVTTNAVVSNMIISSVVMLDFNGQSVGATNKGFSIAGSGADGNGVLQNSSATAASPCSPE